MISTDLKTFIGTIANRTLADDLVHSIRVIEGCGTLDPEAIADVYGLLAATDLAPKSVRGTALRRDARFFAAAVADCLECDLTEEDDYAGIQALNIAMLRRVLAGGSRADLAAMIALRDEEEPVLTVSAWDEQSSEAFNLIITPIGSIFYTPIAAEDESWNGIVLDLRDAQVPGFVAGNRAEAQDVVASWLLGAAFPTSALAA